MKSTIASTAITAIGNELPPPRCGACQAPTDQDQETADQHRTGATADSLQAREQKPDHR
jgi:hypothetical protein